MSMSVASLASFQTWLGACAAGAKTTRTQHSVELGMNWAFGINGFSMGNLLLAPNPKYPNCCSNAASTLQVPGMWTLSGFHPGGCNVLMCDGSVKFLKDSTNLQTIWALGSRAQGEVIDSSAY
jgi:prepilin-type processing-associated H-X9-DG protein